MTDIQKLRRAWEKEGSISQLGMRPAANKEIQKALIPSGGNWSCVAAMGAITRSITWNGQEVALVNPNGSFGDRIEGEIAMGLRATPVMDCALRIIYVLASNPENATLIGQVARAAIDYVEQPAPEIPEPEAEE